MEPVIGYNFCLFFQSLYHTAVGFIHILSVIIYPHSQYLTRISFQHLGIMPVLYLLYGRADVLIIFQFHHNRGLVYRRQGQKYYICVAPA